MPAEKTVYSMSELQISINSAASGDIINLANGTYTNATLTIGTDNITVRAATPGGVYLNGTQSVSITGNYITFSGFQFTSGDIGTAMLIEVSGNNNILTQLNISGYYAQKYIHIVDGSQYNEISYCNIENKPAAAASGCTIQISTSPTVPGYHKIRYCTFQHFPGNGGDFGNEPIRIGLSTETTNSARTIVEHCYFIDLGLGDSETISVKSSENVIRYCTFDYNPLSMLVFRNGDRNIAYGNFFINGSGGIRCKEANDTYCYNNYFETSGIAGSTNPITFDYVSPNENNINFLYNTFVDCGNIDLGGTGPTNCTFANNIFKKSSGNIFTNANTGTTWAGNIYSGTLGITKPSGLTSANPNLTLNSNGYYGLSASSTAAINAASSSYPAILDITNVDDDPSVLLDISGQARPATIASKDIGCDEYTSGTITNKPLTIYDAGPSYLNRPLASQPTIQATNVQFSAITPTSMTISCTAGNGSRRIIVVRSGSSVNSDPIDTTTYTANSDFGSGSVVGAGNYTVYKDTGTSVTVTGLLAQTTYYVKVYELNGTDGSENYLTTSPASGSATTTLAEPTVQATAVQFASLTSTSMVVSCNAGNGSKRIIVMRSGSAVNSDPVDNTTYSASTVFGSGTQIGSGNYTVYKDTGSSVTVTGLTANTTYYVKVYELNGGNGVENYLITNPAANSITTLPTGIHTTGSGGTWSATTTWAGGVVPGSTDNVIIDNGATVTLDVSTTVTSTIINTGGTLTMSTARTLNGNLTVYGTFNATGGFTISMNGNITVSGSAALFKLNSNNSIISSTGTGKVFTISNGATFQTSNNSSAANLWQASTANMTWVIDNSILLTTLSVKNSGVTSIVNPPSSQVIGNLQLTTSSGADNKTFAIGANLSILGNLNITSANTGTTGPTTWNFGTYNITTTGTGKSVTVNQTSSTVAMVVTGTGSSLFSGFSSYSFVPPSNANCIVNYAGAGSQTIAGGTYQHLTSSGGGTKSLAGNVSVLGTLTLTSGNIDAGVNSIAILSTGSVSRTSGHVIGNFTKNVAAGATSKTFEVGDASNYTPVTVAFGNVSISGDLTVKSNTGSHPNIASSGINSAKCLARYWTLTNSGVTFTNYSATFTFVSGDILGSANTSNFIGKVYSASTWSSALPMGTLTTTSSQVTGVTSFGDFAVGEVSVAIPTINISGTLSGFGYIPVNSVSAEQSYTVSGSNVTANIRVTPPTGFQISTGTGASFVATNPVTLTQSGGIVNSTTIYVRFAPLSSGSYSANITHVSTTASQNMAVSGTTLLATEPTTASSGIVYSAYSGTSLTIGWTSGNGSNHLVLVKAGSAITDSPADGVSYTSNTAFGSGSQIGSGNYVVYNGTGNSVTVTGLVKGIFYYINIYEYNGSGNPAENYLTSTYATSYPIAAGSIASANSGYWNLGTTWVGGVAPTSADNVIIAGGHTVNDSASTQSCLNLTVENGGTLRANGSNVTSAASKILKIYGSNIINNGTMGFGTAVFDTSGLRLDIYNSTSTVTFSGAGITKLTKLIPAVVVPEIKISQDLSISYQASYGSAGGAGFQFVNGAAVFSTLTIDAGDTLLFSNNSNFSSVSSATGDATLNYSCNINGAVIGASTVNFRTDATHTNTININAGGSLSVYNSFSPTGAGLSTIVVNGTLTFGIGTADFSNAAQTITGTGNVILPASGTISIGALTGLDQSSGPIRTSTRTFDGSANYTFIGTAAQVTGADLPAAVRNLIINNAAGVSLSNSVTVNNSLLLTNGVLTLGSNNLTLAGSISGTPGASNMVITSGTGEIRKLFSTIPSSFTFPVGTGSTYSPVKITLSSGTLSSAYIAVKVAGTKSSHNTSSSNFINRTWTVTANGITNPVYSDSLSYNVGDVTGTESGMVGGMYNGSSWSYYGSINSSNHAITASGATSFGEITAGESTAFANSGQVNVKVIPQGFYNMADVLNSSDTIRVYLAQNVSPYSIIDSSATILDSLSFIANARFNSAVTGSYYLILKHRNSVETWSSSAISFVKSSTVAYDFTDSQNKAYGNNLVQVSVSPARWAIYGGDVNQDGYVDPLDMSLIDQDSFNYVSGIALATDINGDHYVDPLDMSIADQNSFNYIGVMRPVPAKTTSSSTLSRRGIQLKEWLKVKKISDNNSDLK